ncbi:hypothetical protein [Vibrio phage R01]|nr:hypothetical protein [Vibrio phage R01]
MFNQVIVELPKGEIATVETYNTPFQARGIARCIAAVAGTWYEPGKLYFVAVPSSQINRAAFEYVATIDQAVIVSFSNSDPTALTAINPDYQHTVDSFLTWNNDFDLAVKADKRGSTLETRLHKSKCYQQAVYYWRELPLSEKNNIIKVFPALADGYPSESQFGGNEK